MKVKHYNNITFDNDNISSCNFKKAKITNCKFIKIDIDAIDMSEASIFNSMFKEVKIAKAIFRDCQFTKVSFQKAILIRSDFSRSTIRLCKFGSDHKHDASDLSGSIFVETKLQETDFRHTILTCADFSRSDLGATIEILPEANRIDIVNIILFKAKLERYGLSQKNLKEFGVANCLDELQKNGINIYQGATLHKANLSGAIFIESRLNETDLSEAILINSNLSGAILDRAYLRKANLSNSNLTEASCIEAIFSYAVLENSNMHHARLNGAYFDNVAIRKAKLTRVNLERAYLDGITWKAVGNDTSKKINCFKFCKEKYFQKHTHHSYYKDIRLENAYGNPQFIRFAKECDYISNIENRNNKYVNWVWWIISDYSRSFFRLFLFALITTILFASMYYCIETKCPGSFKNDILLNVENKIAFPRSNYFDYFYFSIVTFSTLGFGDISPRWFIPQSIVILEVIFGYFTLGLLISILSNKISRLS